MKPARGLVALVLGAALVLAGCSSSDDAGGATPTSASPSPSPTPSSVLWANDVCVARDGVGTALSALGHNLSYDVTSDRSALEQIDRQLRLQVIALGNAADNLASALTAVPVDFQAANDLVATVTKARTDLGEAVTATQENLDAMLSADSIVNGVAAAGRALVSAKAAFAAGQAIVGAVTDAVGGANTELRAAFDAAPACEGTPAPSASAS